MQTERMQQYARLLFEGITKAREQGEDLARTKLQTISQLHASPTFLDKILRRKFPTPAECKDTLIQTINAQTRLVSRITRGIRTMRGADSAVTALCTSAQEYLNSLAELLRLQLAAAREEQWKEFSDLYRQEERIQNALIAFVEYHATPRMRQFTSPARIDGGISTRESALCILLLLVLLATNPYLRTHTYDWPISDFQTFTGWTLWFFATKETNRIRQLITLFKE